MGHRRAFCVQHGSDANTRAEVLRVFSRGKGKPAHRGQFVHAALSSAIELLIV
jgi:hypothetical protein